MVVVQAPAQHLCLEVQHLCMGMQHLCMGVQHLCMGVQQLCMGVQHLCLGVQQVQMWVCGHGVLSMLVMATWGLDKANTTQETQQCSQVAAQEKQHHS